MTAKAQTFVFGSEGKPLFIAGPDDGEIRCKAILSILTKKSRPPPAFHFIMPADVLGDFYAAGEKD